MSVVNCFQICIFAVALTTHRHRHHDASFAVNCFQICIFAVALTTYPNVEWVQVPL